MTIKKKVVVLYGGRSAERAVSLESGKNVHAALLKRGYNSKLCDVTENFCAAITFLADEKPEAVFNALHGGDGEGGHWQSVLDMMKIPYTHSGANASMLGMDKVLSKMLFKQAGIPMAKYKIVSRESILEKDPMQRPYVIKPKNEGSSIGVQILIAQKDVIEPFKYDEMIVEEFIAGQEIHVAVLRGEVLGMIEILPKASFFYDYKSKYQSGGSEHIVPKDLKKEVRADLEKYALKAHNILGCRGVSRVDFKYDSETGQMAILEVNTQPGMTNMSLVPDIAKQKGMSYEDVVEEILKDAAFD